MANLNFQPAPRSLASGGVGGRVGSGLVPGVVGHVTPTFGGALSPGRGPTAMPGGAPPSMASRATLFGQRAFADRRIQMPASLSQPNNSMSGMGNLRFNAGSNYHSVFGEGGDTSTPPLLDLSEFPSLTARGAGDQAPTSAPPPPGSKPYVGMVKQPTSEQSEFTMSSEDFPALPGTSNTGATPVQPPVPPAAGHSTHDYSSHSAEKPRKGIQTSPDGKVTNIPETMIPNQFGIVGLLTFIRAAETDPSLVSLALGQDLTALGLNLNSPDNLYLTFAGPWAEMPCRPQDMDYHVPPEYLINGSIRDKLAPLRLSRYKEDTLFYLFYSYVGDVLQVAAAGELYNREWRYHMEEKVWISQAPGMPTVEKTSTYERGTYYFFDAHNWRKLDNNNEETGETAPNENEFGGSPQPPIQPPSSPWSQATSSPGPVSPTEDSQHEPHGSQQPQHQEYTETPMPTKQYSIWDGLVAKEFHLDYSKLEGRPQLPPHVVT